MGLAEAIKEDTQLALNAKMIRALAFVPESHVNEAFDCLIDCIDDRFKELLVQVEKYYIGVPSRCKFFINYILYYNFSGNRSTLPVCRLGSLSAHIGWKGAYEQCS